MMIFKLIVSYIIHWWRVRPILIGDKDEKRANYNYVSKELYGHYVRLCKILSLDHKPIVFVEAPIAKINYSHSMRPEGVHYRIRKKSLIYVAWNGGETVFHLAHEMFHVFLRENKINDFTTEGEEWHCNAFALAYSDFIYNGTENNPFYPVNKSHISYSNEMNEEISRTNDFPLKVKKFAEIYRKKWFVNK